MGKKNVSHGCVRVSREDGEELYKILEKGKIELQIKETNFLVKRDEKLKFDPEELQKES